MQSQIEEILATLDPKEREAVLTILKEQAENSGSSKSLNELYSEDFEELPVDIDTFLESPLYLGNSTNNGTAIYPYWRNAYRQIIDQDKIELCFGGSIGCGKGLTLDTNLLGPHGYYEMRDVKIGSKVAGTDGLFHSVTGVFPQGEKRCYKIIFNDGSEIICDDSHLWSISTDTQNFVTRDMAWILASVKCNTLFIPLIKPLQSELTEDNEVIQVEDRINELAYIIECNGGTRDHELCIDSRNLEIINIVKDHVEKLGGITTKNSADGITIRLPEEVWNTVVKNIEWADLKNLVYITPYKIIRDVEYIGYRETQCISVDSEDSLYVIEHCTVTHNTTAAIYLLAYFFYKLMCLKNPRQYYGLEGNGPICIAFLNNTLALSKGVAYDKFMSTVSNSPWFLERGEVRGSVNIRYKPKKNIEFVIGSSPDQIIGRDIFCLTGDTLIETSTGSKYLRNLDGQEIYVKTLDDNGNVILSEKPCRIVKTKEVVATRMIILNDKSTISCTYNHKFLMADKTYKEAKELKRGDKLYCVDKQQPLTVVNINMATYQKPIPVYDVVNVEPYHNFIVNTGSSLIVSHNCGILDECNFCVSGSTEIVGKVGEERIDEFSSNTVFGYDASINKITSGAHSGAKPTKFATRYLRITLLDDTILECSHNHRFMLANGTYKRADELTAKDDLMTLVPYGYVYKSYCKSTNKCYIGKRRSKVFDRTCIASSMSGMRATDECNADDFEVELLAWALSANELNELQDRFIAKFNAASDESYDNKFDNALSSDTSEGITSKIKSIEEVNEPLQLYDVIDAEPNHNFLISTKSNNFIVSHNSKGADVHFEKNKVLDTYNACFGRIKNRFTVNGKCQGRIFLVSSKKTDYDFLTQFIDKKMASPSDAPNMYVADAKAFEVKPKGSYSGKMFRVAVGGANLPSRIPEDTESTEELIHQGYEVYDAPIELRGDFELDINRYIADHLGVAVSEVIKFIPYNKIEKCYKDIENPVTMEVVKANLADKTPMEAYFKPELVPESIYRKPIFIHIDTSGGKVDNTGISAVAAMGFVSRNRYSEESGNEETTRQMLYRHIFSLGANADKHTEISFQKIVDFLYYLKYKLYWNIKAVSTDGYMGQFLRQQIAAAGFQEVNYVSLDRNPDGYLALQTILAEERIAMIKLNLLESELVRLERNNVSGKIDHPIDGCFIGSTLIHTNKGDVEIASLAVSSDIHSYEVMTYNESEQIFEYKPIISAWLTKYADYLTTVELDDGSQFTCTPDHRILTAGGNYVEAKDLLHGEKLMYSSVINCKSTVRVLDVNTQYFEKGIPVYDLQIINNHNFALDNGVIVHNSKDIADSLAGALYNATLHEKDIQVGGEDLLEMIVETNPHVSTPANSKQVTNAVTSEAVQEIVNKLKTQQSTLTTQQQEILARRQAVIDKMQKEDWESSYDDANDGFLI